jgi:hypothetical protein
LLKEHKTAAQQKWDDIASFLVGQAQAANARRKFAARMVMLRADAARRDAGGVVPSTRGKGWGVVRKMVVASDQGSDGL